MRTRYVKVRRERPSAPALALALAVTMLMVYLLTLHSGPKNGPGRAAADAGARVTREVALEPLALYCLQFGSYASEEEARLEAARYVARGAAGYLRNDGGETRVFGAGYVQRAEAERVAERLRETEGIDCAVLELRAEGLRLRVTAREGQVETVIDADGTMRSQLDQLEALVNQFDRGELSADAARTMLAVQAAQVRETLAALRAIPGEDAIFGGLTARVDELASGLDALARESGANAASLSGRMRYTLLALRIGYIDFLNRLRKAG